MTTSSIRSRLRLLDGRLVERPGLVDDLVADLDAARRASCAPRRRSRAASAARDRRRQVVALALGEEPDVAEVDAEQRAPSVPRTSSAARRMVPSPPSTMTSSSSSAATSSPRTATGSMSGVGAPDVVPLVAREHRDDAGVDAAGRRPRRGVERVASPGVRDDEDVPCRRVDHVSRSRRARRTVPSHSVGFDPRRAESQTRYSWLPCRPDDRGGDEPPCRGPGRRPPRARR